MTSPKSQGAVSRALLAALAVALIGILVMGVSRWMRPATRPDADVGRAVADEFLARLEDGRPGEAWDDASAEFKSLEGRESFIRSAGASPAFKHPLQFASMQEVRVSGEPRSEYVFQTADGKLVRVLVGYDSGAWKVDRLTL